MIRRAILSMLFVSCVFAQDVVVVRRAAACTIGVSCSSITAWVNFEGTDATNYTWHSTECMDNSKTGMTEQTSGTMTTAAITATSYRTGETKTYEVVHHASTAGTGYYAVTSITSGTVIPNDKGTVCIDLKYKAAPAANEYIFQGCGGGCLDGPSFQITTGGAIAQYFAGGWKHTTGSLSTNTAYVIRMSYDTTVGAGTDYIKTYINSGTASATTTGTWGSNAITSFNVGAITSTSAGSYLIEKFAVSTDPTWDCYADFVTNGIVNKQPGMCDG